MVELVMNSTERESLYQLIRDHSHTRGSSMATISALSAYRTALARLTSSTDAFPELFREINALIMQTEPRIISLIHLVEQLEERVLTHLNQPFEALKGLILKGIDDLITLFEAQIEGVIQKGVRVISQGDFIITHSPSYEVEEILKRAYTDQKRTFRVLVVEQDFIRIRNLIKCLHQTGIDHVVIPEYNLSHYMGQVNKLFLGAISISSDKKMVATAGSANIAGLCRHYRIPIYLFICSLKFSHQVAEKQFVPSEHRQVTRDGVSYPVTSYSHDIVDMTLINHIITEADESSDKKN
jgi:translation initiation factor eIF-2B subunit alpha